MSLNFGTKKKVALGGRSKVPETRQQLVQKTHAEREKRARERLEQKSALIIQAWWRSRSTAKKQKLAYRQEWIRSYGELGKSLESIGQSAEILGAVRSLAYFFTARDLGDVARVASAGRAAFQSSASGSPYILRVAAHGGQESEVAMLRIFRMLKDSLVSLELHRSVLLPERGADSQQLAQLGATLMEILIRATDPAVWEAAGPRGAVQLSRLFGRLADSGMFRSVQALITAYSTEPVTARGGVASTSAPTPPQAFRHRPPPQGPTAAVVTGLVKGYLRSGMQGGQSRGGGQANLAVAQLLFAPSLWQSMPALRKHAPKIWTEVVEELQRWQEAGKSLPGDLGDRSSTFLGNLSEATSLVLAGLEGGRVTADVVATATSCFEVLTQLLGPLPQEAASKEEDDDEGHVEGLDGVVSPREDSPGAGTPPPASVTAQLKTLFTPACLQMLATLLLPKLPAETFPHEQPPPPQARRVWAFSRFLERCLGKASLCNHTRVAFAGSPSLVRLMWFEYLKERCSSGRFDPADDDSADPGWMLHATILCSCFDCFLSISPDAVFYDQKQPLPPEELWTSDKQGLLSLLTYALWQTLWVDQGRSVKSGRAQQVRLGVSRSVGKLVGQLNARNCRRRFVSNEAFQLGQLVHAGQVINEVKESLRDGDASMEGKTTRVWRVLKHAPYLLPFDVRAEVFMYLTDADRSSGKGGARITIRRDQIFWDGFEQVNRLGDTIKGRLQVSFVDVHGMPEAGVDGGGLFKDFVENLVKEGFDPALGLFLETSDNRLYPNPSAGVAMDSALPALEFLGKMLGKTLYEGIIVELSLAPFFLKQLLRRGTDINDLATLDQELYRNLMYLKTYDGDMEELALTFTISRNAYGDHQEVPLLPNGANIPVTNANRTEYILRTANYRLNLDMRPYTQAFLHGLESVIDPDWLRMFNEEELQMLIRGVQTAGLDLEELQENVVYGNGYHEKHPTIQAFWQALSEFTPEQQNKWLKFVTACSRPPLLGFRHLYPKLSIAKAGQEGDPAAQQRLPTSSTCMNLMKLPPMTDRRQISQKLLYAMDNVAGFDLS